MEDRESKAVRDARGEARRMARRGGGSYQQCLDAVAREKGHQHWNAFVREQPREPVVGTTEDDPADAVNRTRPGRSAVFGPPMAYSEWRSGLKTMTRDEWDEKRVDAVALRADRISARTGLPLRIIGSAPIMIITMIQSLSFLIGARNGSDVFSALFMLVPAMTICLVCNIMGNTRTLGAFRSGGETLLGLLKAIAVMYAFVHLSIILGDDPKVTAFMSRFYGTFGHTLLVTAVMLVTLHVLTLSLRWLIVVSTRHAPADRRDIGREARTV